MNTNLITKFLRDDSGATAIEYGRSTGSFFSCSNSKTRQPSLAISAGQSRRDLTNILCHAIG